MGVKNLSALRRIRIVVNFAEKALFRSIRRNRISYFVYRKGDFSKDRDRNTRLIWQKDGKRLYVSCPACGSINEAKLRSSGFWAGYTVTPGGFVADDNRPSCLNCHECTANFYAKLNGWTGS